MKHLRRSLVSLRWTLPGLLLGLLPSCTTINRILTFDFVDLPESRLHNLEVLHSPSGKHRYSGEMIGDFSYIVGGSTKTVAGMHIGRAPSSAPGQTRMTAIENPAELCLELLNELLGFDSTDHPRLAGVQVAWSARIATEDPSVLSRERAALGLGSLGARIRIDVPRPLPPEQPRAKPDDVADLLADLFAAWRTMREGSGYLARTDTPSVAEAMKAVRETTFDVDGARRVLVAVGTLFTSAKPSEPGYAELVALSDELQRITIERALAKVILDPNPLVRAAALRATAEAGGNEVLIVCVDVVLREQDPRALRRGLEVILEHGLPTPPPGVGEAEFAQLREHWLQQLVGLAAEFSHSEVRVKAMQVLQNAVPEGPRSLREEDWESWWYERVNLEREQAGLAPLSEVEKPVSEDEKPVEEKRP